MARKFQFVVVSNPAEARSPESKKLTYSHAFRQAHAQKRRKQTENYRKEVIAGDSFSKEALSSPPLSQLLSSNKDPFSSLARPLSSVEYFLLHHCMFNTSTYISAFLLPKHGRDISPQGENRGFHPLPNIYLRLQMFM